MIYDFISEKLSWEGPDPLWTGTYSIRGSSMCPPIHHYGMKSVPQTSVPRSFCQPWQEPDLYDHFAFWNSSLRTSSLGPVLPSTGSICLYQTKKNPLTGGLGPSIDLLSSLLISALWFVSCFASPLWLLQ